MCVRVGNADLSTFQGDDFSLTTGEYDEAGSKYAFMCSCKMQEPCCKFFPSIWRINQNEDNARARARALTFTRIAWINCRTAIVELLLGVHSRISIVLLNSLYPRNPSMPVSLHLLQLTLLELC